MTHLRIRQEYILLWGDKAEKFVQSIIFVMTDFHVKFKKEIYGLVEPFRSSRNAILVVFIRT